MKQLEEKNEKKNIPIIAEFDINGNLYKDKLNKNISFNEFTNLFKVWTSGIGELDHGFVSAICYIEMVDMAQEQYLAKLKKDLYRDYIYQGEYESRIQTKLMDKKINIYACLAMLLHNFHMIQFEQDDEHKNLSLNCHKEVEIFIHISLVPSCSTSFFIILHNSSIVFSRVTILASLMIGIDLNYHLVYLVLELTINPNGED